MRVNEMPGLMHVFDSILSFILFVITRALHTLPIFTSELKSWWNRIENLDETKLKSLKKPKANPSNWRRHFSWVRRESFLSIYHHVVYRLNQSSVISAAKAVITFHANNTMRHLTHCESAPDMPEVLYQSGRSKSNLRVLRAALEAEKPHHIEPNVL